MHRDIQRFFCSLRNVQKKTLGIIIYEIVVFSKVNTAILFVFDRKIIYQCYKIQITCHLPTFYSVFLLHMSSHLRLM